MNTTPTRIDALRAEAGAKCLELLEEILKAREPATRDAIKADYMVLKHKLDRLGSSDESEEA